MNNHDMANQLARRIRNVLGEFNDDDKGVETLVRELAEQRRTTPRQPAARADGVTDGMVLVPREPTEAMADAGYAESAAHRGSIAVRRCWNAMLAAAPSAPQDAPRG